MGGLTVHAVTYVAVNAFLVAVWLLTTGSSAELEAILDDPARNLDTAFWPIWPILAWGTALAIHLGTYAALAPSRASKALRGAQRRALPVPPTPALVHDAGPKRSWIVVMFTDICDSTAHNERLGDEAWHALLSRYRDVVRTAVTARNGTEVATAGDGFLIRFTSPSEAVLCGVDIQRALAAGRAAEPDIPHTRIGLHAGEVVEEAGDVLGHVVNLASRVSSAAKEDEILVTEPVADQLVGSLQLEDRGLQPLKGVSQQRHLLAVRWSDAAVAS